MIAELSLHGVFVPALLVWALIALPLTAALKGGLRRAGVYRFVWHQPLFDFTLFVIMLGGVTAFLEWIVT